jgi:uncharacterized protein YjbJ (UPF0337 family)
MQMKWHQIESYWTKYQASAKQRWSRLTDDQLGVIAGRREQLARNVQEAYGITGEETEKQLSDWQARQKVTLQPRREQTLKFAVSIDGK